MTRDDDPLASAMQACGASLRRAWEQGAIADGSAERPKRYVFWFDAPPSVADRVRQFIAEQRTANRRMRMYEIGGDEPREGEGL